MHPSIRWGRWLIAWLVVTATAIFSWFVLQNLVDPSDGSWVIGIRSDIRRWWAGDLDRSVVLRTGLVVIMVLVVRLGVWLVLTAVAELAGRSNPRPAPRLLAFVITSGVVWGATTGEVAAQSQSCPDSRGPSETVTCSPVPVVVLSESSGADIAGTAVLSGLVGAGIAMRWKARDKAERRRSRGDSGDEGTEIDLPTEFTATMSAAQRSYEQMIDVVRRVMDAEPENRIRHVIDEMNGWIVVEFTDPPKQVSRSEFVHGRALRLKTSDVRATGDDLVDSRLPSLLHVGRSLSGEVWISLDEYSTFEVDCRHDEGDRVWRHLCQSVLLSPSFESRGVVSDRDLGSYPDRRCYVTSHGSSVEDVIDRVGRSIAVIHEESQTSSHPSIRRAADGDVNVGLKMFDDEWRLLPVDVAIRPVGSNLDEVTSIKALLGANVEPIVVDPIVAIRTDVSWEFMACVLGPPRVVDQSFQAVRFERGKAEELVIWLAFHPDQRKRSLARSALWLSPVQDATFSNITAAARRSMNAVRMPPDGDSWVGITMSDDLPLARGVVTDVDVLREAVEHARLRPEEAGIEHLRTALELVRGVPFAGSTYTWSDGIGVCGEAATLVVRAATMMADMCQENGDISGVYWATAKGLLALPGHEELVVRRLRAHAAQGDRASMKAEWESFRRALASEWGDAEPSTTMMNVWRQLTMGWSAQEGHQSGEDTD